MTHHSLPGEKAGALSVQARKGKEKFPAAGKRSLARTTRSWLRKGGKGKGAESRSKTHNVVKVTKR